MNVHLVSSQIAARLRREIEEGRFPLYSRLPAERDLVREFGVSRTTLRKALEILEAEGRIWRHVGQGTFVGTMAPPRSASALLGLDRAATPKEMIEASLIIEPAIASHAALAATEHDIAQMENCLAKRAEAASGEMKQVWDTRFHQLVAEATRNPILVALHQTLHELRAQPEWRAFRHTDSSPAWQAESARYHEELLLGIRNRDPQRAYDAERRLITAIETTVNQPPAR
jgi:DNA-binding FadR family transcriptional regulator